MTILALLLAAQAAPQITSEPIELNRYRLHITAALPSVAAAQAALMPKARELCGKQRPSFGTFRYSQTEKLERNSTAKPPAPLSLDQELFCGAYKPVLDPAAVRPADWAPSPADQQAVLDATYRYFAARDGGDYEGAWSRLSKSMKAMSPAAEWRQRAEAFNGRAGAVRARRVTEITWYNNPPEAPQPGLYVAADFSADFEKLEFLCGYVVWLLQPDGSFALTREEQNMFDKESAKNLASIDRAPLRSQMGCKD